MTLRRVTGAISMVALAVWLGGLVALGAIVAPTVFSRVTMPASADAMTVIFGRFDTVAMSCAAVVLLCEAVRAVGGVHFARWDHARAGASVVAAAVTVYQGASITPRITELHAAGVVRGLGAAGEELSRLHARAEALGKMEVVLLLAVIVLHAVTATRKSAEG